MEEHKSAVEDSLKDNYFIMNIQFFVETFMKSLNAVNLASLFKQLTVLYTVE